MKIFKKQQTKKQITLNIERSNMIVEEINRNIAPANNIYWDHALNNEYFMQDEVNFTAFQRNGPATIIFAQQLVDLYFATYKISLEYTKLTEYIDFIFTKHFENILNHISLLSSNIQELPEYLQCQHLKETKKLLSSIHKHIKDQQDIILKYQQENSKCL